ncbi:acyl-CoA reductase [Aridibaculum aurantiacum]|uniref:acyl-CoA reductase n=1 Tax=Aridibaculum aurantiacum TaxID=2810307 RepID=UPI001A961C0E|nr:acyl-CoA reductase [Aridibaculum aurantiacum]
MTLQQRIELLVELGKYIKDNTEDWQHAKELATRSNPWFIPEFIDTAAENIATEFLDRSKLEAWATEYKVPEENDNPRTVGLVMAGNIPMVGFHDMLCIFISGHYQVIKLSAKDDVLIRHLVKKMYQMEIVVQNYISFAETLKGCDAYIATGSNNTGRYFDYYFGKYPNIIRRNRTSVAVLQGNERPEELDLLATDIQMYFGLGCRNVTKLYVPEGYNFEPLLQALNKYDYYNDFHKYKNNYDYQLALLMMGRKFYMTNGSILLNEATSIFTAVSQVNFEFYQSKETVLHELQQNNDVQCIVGKNAIPFGLAQKPTLKDYADGVDTMQFLMNM